MVIIMGFEGGATSTKAVIVNQSGEVIAYAEGPHTTQTLIGAKEVAERISGLIRDCLRQASLPDDSRIDYLGLSLGGIDTLDAEQCCRDAILARWTPGIGKLAILNDTMGALRTADNEGIVLISGTGSNCRLVHEDLTFHRVGGLGNMLGDEGSAYWIVTTGTKRLIDNDEGLILEKLPMTRFRKIVMDYFHLDEIHDLLQVYFKNFDKAHIAKMCVLVADCARNEKDAFCIELFNRAGFFLGRMVATMARHCEKHLLERDGGLPVVCVGSVWNSWDLLKTGFLNGLKPQYSIDVTIKSICLKKLKMTAAYGAAIIACEGDHMKPNYSNNSEIFFHCPDLLNEN